MFGSCQCESRKIVFQGNSELELSSTEERNVVLAIFSRYYNALPQIPDLNGTFQSSAVINRECANEMYLWCRAQNFFRLWAYMSVNWYRYEQWKLWARSTNADEIPILKTTMIVKSHWQRIKYDFLH